MNSLKQTEKQKRTVFKPLLDNPFPQSQFPHIESAIQRQILHYLLLELRPLANYNELIKKDKTLERPIFLQNSTLGFNSTVKSLEASVQGKQDVPIHYVFVCRSDLSPSLLTAQFPNLCYMASLNSGTSVKLIQLPKNSINELKEAASQNISIIGLSRFQGLSKEFIKILDEQVPSVDVPWLKDVKFIKPDIKIVKTSATIKSKVDKQKKSKKP